MNIHQNMAIKKKKTMKAYFKVVILSIKTMGGGGEGVAGIRHMTV